ncbi:hypothetical protein BLNAU_18914 [Blattamonas nauphoetae]|uniref:non-specific serine/threonine protein kinase n=1 Tax=Blattamonas nauphoetae TaxID=2049346 RepID=A0ABQ9X3A1_9EUKA|nr:hypothetical protein BLNAU_18914 [Blattamonas nauphoetae]
MGGHQAIVMEFGTRSLKDLINEYEARNELIPLPLTVMILSDICEGLLWMHTHSSGPTAHGDLKPENVLLRENNRAFLCDLGGSAPMDQQLTQTIAEMGTFEYNSPERVMDSKGTATPASDVWSLGVLAYRMVTGKSLFEGLTLPQLCLTLGLFNESKIPTTIPSLVRDVLLKMLEPNVALRATTTALFEGGLLERMLGPETALSQMKDIQLATRAKEIMELSSDAKVKEKTMELEMEKQKLLEETKELENQLRSLQMSLQRTSTRNVELEKEEKLEQRQNLLATHTSTIQLESEHCIRSTKLKMPTLQFHKDDINNINESSHFDVSGSKITRTGHDKDKRWSTTLFEEPISKGVVSVAITVLAIPETTDSEEGLMFGLVDALSRPIQVDDQLGGSFPNSIAFAPMTESLFIALPSTKQRKKQIPLSGGMAEGDRVVLEVDMDARPRTAVFIINGTVSLTFVSGLPPSIRFGLSMKNEGVSVRYDGMSRLKQATPLRRVNEIEWNPEDLRDSEDMYMNGNRANVLTIHPEMPSLVFTDPSHFRVEDNLLTSTGLATNERLWRIKPKWSSFLISEPIHEGIVAVSFTFLSVDNPDTECRFGLIDGTTLIPEKGQKLGDVKNSIALSSTGELHFLGSHEENRHLVSSGVGNNESLVVEINMDSNPRTAQFFVNGKSATAVVVDLPESVRVGFSAKGVGMRVRFDRITTLSEGNPFTDHLNEFKWSDTDPLQVAEIGEGTSHTDTDDDNEDDATDVDEKKRQLPTMKLPELLFTDKSHFIIRNNVLTRTEKGSDKKGRTRPSTVLFSEPITKGVVSVTFVVLTLAKSIEQEGFVNFGLLDARATVPRLGLVLGKDVKDSIALSTSGDVHVFNKIKLKEYCSDPSKMNRIVMEVNMDSTPRTVQFFINGQVGQCYVSGIPESVRIGFSADVMGTSLQIASIIHSTQATPIANKMKEIKWSDTKQSLKERNDIPSNTSRRPAEGSMPALLSRNPEHLQIEGNVITHTALGSSELTSPFSTVMLDGVVEKAIKSVTVTILALPETENSIGVVMIGCLSNGRHIPKSPKGLGIGKKTSFALCSSDGYLYDSEREMNSKPNHSPLQVGDQVVLEVNTQSTPDISRFLVNGKAGETDFSGSSAEYMIGFSLAGLGTSIRIDAVTELDKSSPIIIDVDPHFELMVMNASSGKNYTLRVYPNNTILQIKQLLVHKVSGSIEDIELMFEADTLDDSTTLSELAFDDRYALIAFDNGPVDSTTDTVQDHNTEDQPLTALPPKETSDDVFDLMLKCATTGDMLTLRVHPYNTIRQIKQSLVPRLSRSIDNISLMLDADDQSDSTILSKIDFNGNPTLIAFINESNNALTVPFQKRTTKKLSLTTHQSTETNSDEFDLKVKTTLDGDEFTLHVHPQNTILQIKEALVLHVGGSIEDISLLHETGELRDNSKTLSESYCDSDHNIIIFIHEPGDTITGTNHDDDHEKQPSTSSPSKKIINDKFKLMVMSVHTGDQYNLNVHSQKTILQIKRTLVSYMSVSIRGISLFHKTDKLSDSTTLSEISFNDNFSLIAFIRELDDQFPTTNHEDNDEEFDLEVLNALTGERFTLNVHPQDIILKIKQLLVPQLNVPYWCQFDQISYLFIVSQYILLWGGDRKQMNADEV